MTTTATEWPGSWESRAIAAARRYRSRAPAEFAERHSFPLCWYRRAMTAANIATALGVPIDTVVVRADHHRHHGLGGDVNPGELIEIVTDNGIWHFLPDLTGLDSMWGWLLLGPCPACSADAVPLARVASIADLGAYLDPDPGHDLIASAPPEFHDDPCHYSHCPHAAPTIKTGRVDE